MKFLSALVPAFLLAAGLAFVPSASACSGPELGGDYLECVSPLGTYICEGGTIDLTGHCGSFAIGIVCKVLTGTPKDWCGVEDVWDCQLGWQDCLRERVPILP